MNIKKMLLFGQIFESDFLGKTIRLIADDEEYIRLRIERNNERDRIGYDRGSVKHLDEPLELYERSKGTEYCQKIYLQATGDR